LKENCIALRLIGIVDIHDYPDTPHALALLRVSTERNHCNAANRSDKFAPPHVRPRALDTAIRLAD